MNSGNMFRLPKHCMLTLHVKAANFSLLDFLSTCLKVRLKGK